MTDTPRLEEKVFWDHVASEEDKASCLAQPNSYIYWVHRCCLFREEIL